MALVKCKECGNQISKSAKACPACGAPVKKGVGLIGWIFVLVIVLPIAWNYGSSMGKPESAVTSPAKPSAPAQASATPATPTTPVEPVAEKPDWHYGETQDSMTEEPMRYAVFDSPTRAFFDFPYEVKGGSTLSVIIRKSGRLGEDVLFKIDKGHVVCHRSSCEVAMKIGDGPVKTVQGVPAQAGNTTTIFLASPADLKPALMAGRPFKVEVQFYKSGTKTFAFEPPPLKW